MENKEKILDEAYKKAYRYETELGSCPQCVLAALYETLNISYPKKLLRLLIL